VAHPEFGWINVSENVDLLKREADRSEIFRWVQNPNSSDDSVQYSESLGFRA
jgi:hypothetical protein